MKKYALSLSAQKIRYERVDFRMCAAVIKADSEYEAIGIGIKLAENRWPNESGRANHACAVCLIED